MTSSVRILSTTTADSSPAVLFVAPNGNKTLVNCGEGSQRIFLEHGQKLSTVRRVCLTHLSHSTLGGLPGMILTSADIMAATAVAAAKATAIKQNNMSNNRLPNPESKPMGTKRSLTSTTEELPGLDLMGPIGTGAFIHSLRHFMRREAFKIRIQEGSVNPKENNKTQDSKTPTSKKRRQKQSSNVNDSNCSEEDDFRVQSIACVHTDDSENDCGITQREALSFIFTTPPVQGKFMIDKARALGIPPGPLYGQLKSGKTVTFADPTTGEERTVNSFQVVEPGNPGVAVVLLYYPCLTVMEQLSSSTALTRLSQNRNTESEKGLLPQIEVVIHITSKEIFGSSSGQSFRKMFEKSIEQIFLSTDLPNTREEDPGTPFHAASAGAVCRARLSEEIYVAPYTPTSSAEPSSKEEKSESTFIFNGDTKKAEVSCDRFVGATPLLEYILIPLAKRGFINQKKNQNESTTTIQYFQKALDNSNAISVAMDLLGGADRNNNRSSTQYNGQIIFTGTGSAIPCKHRNVSGIYFEMSTRNSILLDIGEGTVGQLLRARHGDNQTEVLKGIRAVWISHPHADHHLGILRLLTERSRLTDREDSIILIAPPNLKSFLDEYQCVDPDISESYEFVDCRDVSTRAQTHLWSTEHAHKHQRILKRLEAELGISAIQAIPVAHCPHSYAVHLSGTPFGAVAYSGDCRPSMQFASIAQNTDLLIHEATFTDGMEAEAAVKRHSTVGEALQVATRMRAKTIVLTHFSQRYPKIPPVSKTSPSGDNLEAQLPIDHTLPVVFAFDYMRLTPSNLIHASRITPAVRLLYPETTDDDENSGTGGAEALDIPGMFAQKELL